MRVRPSGAKRTTPPLRWALVAWLTAGSGVALLVGCGSADADPTATWSTSSSDATTPASPTDTAASLPAASPSATAPASPSASTTPTSPAAQGSKYKYVFPVVGHNSYARTHHDYPASDIIAACGLKIRAVTNGVVLEVNRVDKFDPDNPKGADKGGLFVSILGDDGVRYYGSHMSQVTASIEAGVRVTVGQQIGKVGTTGNSGACHLHFGISPPCMKTGDWWTRRGAVYPWSYLDSWKAGGTKSPVAAVASWKSKNGCPTNAPS
ncbi:MAG: M23 family metallopeptidase [Micromonosporaceae bacterium]|nr:M23 family metallopeptidase [Micromonosporaceae bacterium]